MNWKEEKDGLTVKYTKGNLRVMWDLGTHRYQIRRADVQAECVEIVEQGHAEHLSEAFMQYVEETWGNQ